MFLPHNFHTDAVYVIIWLSWVSRSKFVQGSFHSCHSCCNILGFGANLDQMFLVKQKIFLDEFLLVDSKAHRSLSFVIFCLLPVISKQ